MCANDISDSYTHSTIFFQRAYIWTYVHHRESLMCAVNQTKIYFSLGLQVVMSAILKSMASLLQICLLIGFVIVIYAIIAMSFLTNLFHFTCFYTNTTSKYIIYTNIKPIIYKSQVDDV